MSINLNHLGFAESAIREGLELLGKYHTVDMHDVDFQMSAIRGLEAEEAHESDPVNILNMKLKPVRLVLAAVYFDGTPVVDPIWLNEVAQEEADLDEVMRKAAHLDTGACDVWDDHNSLCARKQVKHSDLTVLDPDQIIVGDVYIVYDEGEIRRVVRVDDISSSGNMVMCHVVRQDQAVEDGQEVGRRFFLFLSDFGVLPQHDRTWNSSRWLETTIVSTEE
jgi:hypothetical protein